MQLPATRTYEGDSPLDPPRNCIEYNQSYNIHIAYAQLEHLKLRFSANNFTLTCPMHMFMYCYCNIKNINSLRNFS